MIKYLNEEISKRKYTDINTGKINNVKEIMRLMVYAENEDVYVKCMEFLKRELGQNHDFVLYFLRNWDNCKLMWVKYLREDIPHLGNNTNNRLESNWGKLKHILNKDMQMDECVTSLLILQKTQETKFHSEVNCLQLKKT